MFSPNTGQCIKATTHITKGMDMEELAYEGREIKIGKKIYYIPELTWGRRRKFDEGMNRLFSTKDTLTIEQQTELRELMYQVALTAIRMNYPEIDEEWFQNTVTESKIGELWRAALNVKEEGGESTTKDPISRSNGLSSTALS